VATSTTHRVYLDGPPPELRSASAIDVARWLDRPTLIRVPGRGEQAPRAVSCLLHGDESTGLEAVLRLLRRDRSYAFDLYVVVGNARAAAASPGFAHRYLDDQEDFNRVWGLREPTTSQRLAADAILDHLLAAGLEALVDVHNNSGNNPFYAIVTRDDPRDLNLATLFTSTLLHWDLAANTLMESLPPEVAAIAVECGLPGRPESRAFALDGLRRFLGEPPLPTDRVVRDFDRLGGLRKVTIRPEVRFRFGRHPEDRVDGDDVDFVVAADADLANFVEVPPGHVVGHVREGAVLPLHAVTATGHDVTGSHFAVDGDRVVTTVPTTPVMMTRTVAAARKDCLFYVSTELPPPEL
jgi:hypothetical protein